MQTLQKETDYKEKYEIGEFWTAKQRQMFPLHYTVSYRGSFKAELPHFFIDRYLPKIPEVADLCFPLEERPIVFDPFAGRGTTALQANIMGFPAIANDINPMLERILYPLTHPVKVADVKKYLEKIPFSDPRRDPFSEEESYNDFRPFYDENTFSQLLNLKDYLQENRDQVDRFIEVVALSRLHGHSKGFFSAYSFPQISVLPNAQEKINQKHGSPEFRDVPKLILRKAKAVLKGESRFYQRIRKVSKHNNIYSLDSRDLNEISSNSIDLIITSPPFLAQVDYVLDNWIECWFLGLDQDEFRDNLIMTNDLNSWKKFINDSMLEFVRVLKSEHKLIIEVGDVSHNRKRINLDEIVLEIGEDIGLNYEKAFINSQKFTKLSNCFRVTNNEKGVNTNRMVVFEKS
ncbi:MAG: site-specific DNA-methyltransferase [Candidatus Hodarchaeales archaeon]|jgi:hypothetical protein